MSQLSTPAILNLTPTGFTVRVISNIAIGTAYCVAVPFGQPAPSRAQIKAGQNYLGLPAPGAAQTVIMGLTITFPAITTLNAVTQYDVYCVQYNADNPDFTHYVSPTGTASWAEAVNIETPCSKETAMLNAVPDNVVGFRGGIYEIVIPDAPGIWDTPVLRPSNSGTLGHPITFKAYTGEVPYMVKAGAGSLTFNQLAATAFGCDTGDEYIIWDGFAGELAANSGSPAYNTNMLFILYGAINCTVRNSDLYGTNNGAPQSGGNTAPMIVEWCTDCEVYDNRIRDNVGVTLGASDNNTCGIWVFADTRTHFHNNEISGCAIAVGQKTGPNQGTRYSHNYFHDNYLYHFRIIEEAAGTTRSWIDNNFLRDTDTQIFIEGSGGTAIWTIHNNTMVRSNYAVFSYVAVSGTEIYNNIFYQVGSDVVMHTGYFPAVQDYNCYYPACLCDIDWSTQYTPLTAWQAASIFDDNSNEGDPVFINGAGNAPTDFTLDIGSSCLGTGVGGVNIGVINPALVGIGNGV